MGDPKDAEIERLTAVIVNERVAQGKESKISIQEIAYAKAENLILNERAQENKDRIKKLKDLVTEGVAYINILCTLAEGIDVDTAKERDWLKRAAATYTNNEYDNDR